ncbi:MAG: TIGR00159 family protein [Candidatus Cloacimonetes bacterium]|nr:TIGR00159 family protein [Candidatus Cloacimonadota bacterium]MBL7107916.1 TIGR00159 family protein [Candidatus Cloacimonadota bacterium]
MNFLLPNILDILDIIVVAYIFYRIILLVRGTKTYQVLWGLLILLIFYFVAIIFNLKLLGSIINILKDFWIIALVVLFQPEIRTALIKFGQKPIFRSLFPQKQQIKFTKLLNAIRNMSYHKIGGIFVIVNKVGVDDYLPTGEVINSELSEKLILAIFNKKSILHDGAIIIKNNRIIAAKVVLPLTTQEKYAKKLGTRHQAGIGISEQTDAFVIIISEYSGKISTVKNGIISEDVPIDILSQTLIDELEK